MAVYYFKVINREGETIEDLREALDEASLLVSLQNEGFIPIRISEASTKPFAWLSFAKSSRKISSKEIGLFTHELLTLLQAGLPLDKALMLLSDLTRKQVNLNALIDRILESVKGGAQLSDALEAQNQVFSRFYINLIRAGELGGALEQVLQRLADYLDRSRELRETVSTAMIYPAILVLMACGSLILLLTFVVPQFSEMFESAGKELPIPTQIVMGLAYGLKAYGWILPLLVIGIAAYFRYQLADSNRRLVWDKRLLNIPLLGDLIVKISVANFSRTLATLLINGVSLLSALTIVKETLTNRAIAEKIDLAIDSLKQGKGLANPLIESGIFPNLAVQMVKLGEESGKLDEMLERIAIAYDKEIKLSVQRLLALLEPVLIVGLGILIGGIIISVLMAILSVNDLAF